METAKFLELFNAMIAEKGDLFKGVRFFATKAEYEDAYYNGEIDPNMLCVVIDEMHSTVFQNGIPVEKFNADLKQDKTDEALETESKEIAGAINEVNEKAEKAKEIVLVDIQKMLEEQDVTLFMDLSQRYANGEIVIVGLLGNQYGIISGVDMLGENAHWVVTSGAWGEPMLEGGEFKPFITVYGLECDGEKIVIGSGSIENLDLSGYVKFENRDTFVKEGLTEAEETWTDDEKESACEIIGAVAKVDTPHSRPFRFYAVDKDGNQIIVIAQKDAFLADTVTMRGLRGSVVGPIPTSQPEYTPKKYVDNLPNYLTLTDDEKAKWQEMLGVDNRFNIINAILSQSGIVKKYKQPITHEYTERVTADGANVYDGSKAILQKVVGNTVRCKNLFDAEYWSQNHQSNGQTNIVLTNGNTYTISCVSNIENYNTWICAVAEDETVANVKDERRLIFTKKGTMSLTFTIPNDGKVYKFGFCRSGAPVLSQWQSFFNGNYCTDIQVEEGSTATEYQPYFTGLKSASFAGIESKNDDVTETSMLAFPKTEMPLGTTIDFEQKKITDYGVEIVLNGEELWTVSPGYTVNNTYYSSMYAKCLTSNENRTFGIATEGTVRSGQSGVYGHGVWWIGTGGLYLYLLGAEQYFNLTKFADPNNPTDEERENLKTEWKAYLAQRYADGNPVTIRYVSSVLQSETPFTEEQSAIGNEYTAYKGGTEKVLNNDGAEYGADNTLTQDYILVAEVD